MSKSNDYKDKITSKYAYSPFIVRFLIYIIYYCIFVVQGIECGDFWDLVIRKENKKK